MPGLTMHGTPAVAIARASGHWRPCFYLDRERALTRYDKREQHGCNRNRNDNAHRNCARPASSALAADFK